MIQGVHRVPGRDLQQAHNDNRQPATAYLESGLPQKCPTDSYLVHEGMFKPLKIKKQDSVLIWSLD